MKILNQKSVTKTILKNGRKESMNSVQLKIYINKKGKKVLTFKKDKSNNNLFQRFQSIMKGNYEMTQLKLKNLST
jgi:hypothetical protein